MQFGAIAFRNSTIGVFAIALVALLMPSHALSDWREDLGTFRIGVIGGTKPQLQTKRVEGFRAKMQELIGMPVEIYAARDYASLIDAHTNARIEYAVYSSSAFAAAWNACECIEPLVAPKNADGSHGFYSIMLVKNNGPRSLKALRAKRIAITSVDSLAGYHIPVSGIKAAGVVLDDKFVETVVAESSENAYDLFLSDEVDAIFGWTSRVGDSDTGYSRGTLNELAQREGVDISQFRTLWQSRFLPHGPHAVSKKLPKEARDAIQEMLLSLYDDDPATYDAIEPFSGGGFTIVKRQEYQPFIDLVRALQNEQD